MGIDISATNIVKGYAYTQFTNGLTCVTNYEGGQACISQIKGSGPIPTGINTFMFAVDTMFDQMEVYEVTNYGVDSLHKFEVI